MFYILFISGLLIRLLLIPLPGFKADMAFWKGWGLAIADRGIIWTTENTNYNYPPGFASILFLVNKVYGLLESPYDVNSYWQDSNLLYLFLLKIITIAADVAVVFLILKIAKKLQSNLGPTIAIIYFLNPASIYDGAVWGQVDQIGLLLFLITFYFLLSERIILASIIFVISFMMKFQNIIFIPLFYLYILKKYSWSKLIDCLKYGLLTFIIINASFFIHKRVDLLLKLLLINNNYFPFYSLNAFNVWWILSGLDGMKLNDTNLLFGVTTARSFSVAIFAFFYSLVFLSILKSDKEKLLKNFILGSAVLVFAFFHVLTQSHERYLFPLVGLLPLLMMMIYKTNKSDRTNRWFFYLLFSLAFFLNVYLTMFFNYPEQTFWPFNDTTTKNITWWLSVFQILIFIYFFVKYFLGEMGDKSYKNYIGAITFILILILAGKNLNYWLGQPVSLTSIPPLNFIQEYSVPSYNKNLNAINSPFSFGRLSSNYYFYDRGIASHANSAIVYNLNQKFSKFKTDYGIDTEGTANAEVYFIIEGDGRELFRSGKKGRFDNPSTVEVDVTQVDQLVLKIERIGESNYGHHADWLGPVLMR